jgi:ankyrin repeat protein
VRLLIGNGAQVNSPDFGNAPLTQAISRNRYDVAVLLIENGANAKAENADHYTLLHVATSTDNPRLAELLLQHGADINARPPRTVILAGPQGRLNVPGETPLKLALMEKHNRIAQYLRAQGGVE